MQWPMSFICPNRSWVLPFPAQETQHWSSDGQYFTSRARCIDYTLFSFQTDPPFPLSWHDKQSSCLLQHWAEIGQGVFKEKSTCRSHEFPSGGRQPAGQRRQKQKGVGWCWSRKLLLLFSYSAVPDGWSHPACCISVYRSRHCLAVQEGGRQKCQS